jgi:tetratricopeptide (TPR) repeat protein
MTDVVCKKCGKALSLDGGLPSVWKVIKCPSCNHPNILQGGQPGGGPGPAAKPAPPSVPVTLGPPGAKVPPPAPPKSAPAESFDLGGSGNETAQEDPLDHDMEHALQDAGDAVALGEAGDEEIDPLPLVPDVDDVDLGESGNETFPEPAAAAPERRRRDADMIDLGAPGNEALRQRQRSLDSAATVDLGPPGYGPLDDLLSPGSPVASRAPSDVPGFDQDVQGIEIVDLPDTAQGDGGLAGFADDADLPAPVAQQEPEILNLPPPQAGRRAEPPRRGAAAPARASHQEGLDLPAPAAPAAQPASARRPGSAADLPAPARRPASVADLPAPAQRPASVADLPAPAQRSASVADLPAPAQRSAGGADLPAPARRPASVADLPAPAQRSGNVADLPVPAQRPGTDLPAPARRSGNVDNLPTPASARSAAKPSHADLPQPARSGRPGAAGDLPAPKGFFDDLPEPADSQRPAATGDLPAPKGFFDDLLEPADSQRPAAAGGLPAPKGFFDDLPEPAETKRPGAAMDLPAPTGFELGGSTNALDLDLGSPASSFDDLGLAGGNDAAGGLDLLGGPDMDANPLGKPARAGAVRAAGKAPAGGAELDDPFGFGDSSSSLSLADPDEIPPPAAEREQPFALNALELEASRGEDSIGLEPIPLDRSEPTAQPPAASAKAQRAGGAPKDKPASGGLDGLELGGGPGLELGGGPGLELGGGPGLELGGDSGLGLGGSDLGLGGSSGADLGGGSGLELGGGSDLGLDDFGLPEPRVPGMPTVDEPPRRKVAPAAPAKAAPKLPAAKAAPRKEASADAGPGSPQDEEFGGLELPSIAVAAEEAPAKPKATAKAEAEAPAKTPQKPAKPRGRGRKEEEEVPIGIEQTAVPRLVHGHLAGSTLTERHLQRQRQRRKRILTAVAAGLVLVLAGGGFFLYQQWSEERAYKASVQAGLSTAVAHLREGDAGHWDKAFTAAQDVLKIAPNHPEGLGIAAEAAFAALLDEGLRVDELRKHGTEYTRIIDQAALMQGEHINKAQALKSIDQGRGNRAVELLQPLLAQNPSDPDTLLYLGWAHAAMQDHKNAVTQFQRALETAPQRQIPALYGLARAQLAQGDQAAARASFEKILAARKDHVGALLGMAEAAEVAEPEQREAMYLEVLNRPGAAQADPRAVSRGWMLAGRLSLDAGRVEEAKTRFDKALTVHAANPAALIGRAKVAILQGRYDAALEALKAVIGTDPASVDVARQADAVLTWAELAMSKTQPEPAVATTYINLVIDKEKELSDPHELARAYALRGRLLASDESKREEAIAAYKRALELAGQDALEPALALADLYTTLGRMEEARTVLTPIEQRAGGDATTAIALGIRYKRANSWADAETWLRRALELKPKDIDAQFQLGQVLAARKQYDEAIQILDAAARAAPSRTEIGLHLAMVFEETGRIDDAAKAYEELLKGASPTLETMARAGRFYVRQGQPAKAGELGERILAVKDSDPAGNFLRGEGQYHAGNFAEARVSFRRAADIEPDPHYFEASGRASEQLDGLQDEAFEAYAEASRLDPNYVAPRIGRARLLLLRRDFKRAIEELEETRKLAPQNASVFHYLGEAYQQQEDHKQAVSYFRTALQYDRQRAETHYRMGKSYIELNKERDAAGFLTDATALARRQGGPTPKWLEDAYYELGYVQRSLSKRGQAIEAWKAYLELVPPEKQKQNEVVEVKRLLMSLEAQR